MKWVDIQEALWSQSLDICMCMIFVGCNIKFLLINVWKLSFIEFNPAKNCKILYLWHSCSWVLSYPHSRLKNQFFIKFTLVTSHCWVLWLYEGFSFLQYHGCFIFQYKTSSDLGFEGSTPSPSLVANVSPSFAISHFLVTRGRKWTPQRVVVPGTDEYDLLVKE